METRQYTLDTGHTGDTAGGGGEGGGDGVDSTFTIWLHAALCGG